MLCREGHHLTFSRPGVAAVELAVLLPFLCFILVAAVDFGRVFYCYITVTNSARNAAVYGSMDALHSTDTVGIQSAALAEASFLSPAPTVSSITGNDGAGNPYVRVTVTYAFKSVTNFPGIPSSASVNRVVQMRVLPP